VVVNAVAQVAAGLAALIHVVVWVWESFLFRRVGIHQGIFRIATADVPAVLLWSVNQGFYNLFLAAGTVFGLVSLHAGNPDVGRAFVFYTCGFMLLCGLVLAISDLLGLGRAKGSSWGGAVAQAGPPLIVFVAAAVS
jgi:putative membrane protein